MKTLHLAFWRTVFTKWMLLSMIGFSGCDGKFYTVEELTLPQQTIHIKTVKVNTPEQTYAQPEKLDSPATESTPRTDEKHQSATSNTAEFSGTASNYCEH